jgi:hypothetical protein
MKLEPPESVSQEQITIDVREIEPLLQAPAMDLKPWPEAMIKMKDGRELFIRQATLDDVPLLLTHMRTVMECDRDFYDIVGARVYAEILGWYRKRVKDPFTLIGTFDGMLAGFANGRFMTEDIAISLHTMTFARRGRIGYAMYYAKTYYALEIMKCKEWWSTFESYNGWRMAGLEMAQPTYPWPETQHELGGATVYYVNQSHWKTLKNFTVQMIGSDLTFDVPDDVRKRNEVLRIPDEFVP